MQGERSQISGSELTTDILIGAPTALIGGAVSNAATGELKKAAANQVKSIIQGTATKEYKNLIKSTLKERYPGLGNSQIKKIANQTIKTIQSEAKNGIEAVRVSIQAGIFVGTEAVTQVGSVKVDEEIGD